MSPTTEKRLTFVLTLQAVVSAVAVAIVLTRDVPPNSAIAQPVPIAGGGGVYMMPGQLSATSHGLFVMDTERQNILVYQYDPSERNPADRSLVLRAARNFTADRELRNYNTDPSPLKVRELVDEERAALEREANPKPKAE